MNRWKLFLILILAVVLLHILIIKIFIIGFGDDGNTSSVSAVKNTSVMAEPQLPERWRKK